MWRDHFRSFWRGVLNNKLTTFINVGGLALGLMVFFALTFYVQREFSWDAHWEDADRIYATAGVQENPTGNSVPILAMSPYVLGTSLQTQYPNAFDSYARVFRLQGTFVIDGEQFSNRAVHYSEPTLLDLFQIETVEGFLRDVFADPRAVAINVDAIENLFGRDSPLGKTVTFDSRAGLADYTIKAVYRIPEPSTLSDLQFLALLDPTALPLPNATLDRWSSAGSPQPQTLFASNYFKLRPGFDADAIQAGLGAFMDQNQYMQIGSTKTRFTFVPIQDVHLMPTLFSNGNSVERLRVYAAIGLLVLLISGCNFVMLATLRSVDRMREIGIRKTIGGQASQLMRQYLLDVFCQTFAAAFLALVLLEFSLPLLQARLELGDELDIELLHWRNVGLCLGIIAIFTLVSGAYRAYLMVRRKPAALLRNASGAVVASGNFMRRLLVGIQFAIVIMLLVASAVVVQQIEYTRSRNRGYDLENVMGVRVAFDLLAKVPALLTEFEKVQGVDDVAVGNISPGAIMISPPVVVRFTASNGAVTEASMQASATGVDYFGVMSVPVLAGREFASDIEGLLPQDTAPDAAPALMNIVLNDSAARALGFQSPNMAVDSLLEAETRTPDGQPRVQAMRVIGVVADTQFSSAMLPPVPQYYPFSPQNGFVAIKLAAGADPVAVMAGLQAAWTAVMGETGFTPVPRNVMEFDGLAREEFEERIVIGSTLLAMVIALMGLYGLVAATVVKSVKEIGVRKVMGADRLSIVALLLWQFSKPIVIANLVAWPLGFWGITQWLQRFPYRLDMGVILWSALVASVLALLVAWLTVGLMAAKAASAKPVLALRYE
jgi:putative ABC transport system permease protein